MLMRYRKQMIPSQLNLLDSHDVPRFLTLCGGDRRRYKLALLFMFSFVGMPMLFYGDELGMEGGEDPDCRRPMRWDDVEGNPTRAHYQKLARCAPSSPHCAWDASAAISPWKTACTPSGAKPIPSSCSASVNTGLEPVSVAAGTARGHGGNGGRA